MNGHAQTTTTPDSEIGSTIIEIVDAAAANTEHVMVSNAMLSGR